MNRNNLMEISLESLIVFFVSLYPIMPTYFRITFLTGTNFVALIFVIFVLLEKGGNIYIEVTSVERLVLAWVLVQIVIQLLHSYSFTTPLMLFIRYIAVLVLFPDLIKTKRIFLKVIDILIFVSILISIFGIIESIFKFNVFELLNNSGANITYNQLRFGLRRIIGFTPQTITYCIYQVFIGALIFYRLTMSIENKKQLMFKVAYVLSLIAAILTLSRSALLFYFVIQMFLLIQIGYKKFVKKVIMIAIFGFLAIFLISVINQGAAKALDNFLFMFLAIFNENYSSRIATAFGNDNLSAVGNRIQLYQWVWETLKDHKLLGIGNVANFKYSYSATNGTYSWVNTKTSIEVEWLSTLYEYGILGLITEIAMYISLIINELRTSKNIVTGWESKLGFGKFCFILTVGYIVMGFAVSFSLEDHLFFIIVSLWIAYVRNGGFNDDEEISYENWDAWI